ncbi:hypothetical protein ACOTTU_24575 [Roseobacter sp. EG26]|uniref:hypothetical protein n=1 Tax=Roseobacter sp. EG26 TaxID=3412477 RepID=UPI003CE526DF
MKLPKDLTHPLATIIEQCEYLRTVEIFPVCGSLLEFHAGAGKVFDDPHTIAGIEGVRSIEVPPKSDRYSFKFANFVSYSVTDEMFINTVTDEVFKGGRLRSYSKSHFLDYVSAATSATDHFPGNLLHYQLNTLDHTIDVITAEPPELVMAQIGK